MANDLMEIAAESTRGGFFLVSGTALSTIIMALASILVARFLGPELYGQYTLALVTPQLLLLFTDMGINQGLIKYTASLRQRGEMIRVVRIIKYGLLIKALSGITIFIISYVFSGTLASTILQRPDLTLYVRIASISVLFQAIFTTLTSTFVGLDKTEYNALATNVHAISKAIISISLVLLGFGLFGAILGHVASYIIAAITSVLLLTTVLNSLKNSSKEKGFNDSNEIKTLINYGLPLYISAILIGFIPYYQSIVLAIYTSDVDVGNFKAATNFIALMTVLTVPITTALLSAFSKLDSETTQKIRHFFKLANKYATLVILPITFLIIIFSSEIVQIIYGSTYQYAPQFLASYCLIYMLTGLGFLTLTSLFNGLGDTKTTLKISLITSFSVIVLAPLLTLNYKVYGLIISFIIANMFGTLYGARTAVKKLQVTFDKHSLFRIYLCSIFSAFPVFMLKLTKLPNIASFIGGVVLYLSLYLTLIPLTKTITDAELATSDLIIQKVKFISFVMKPLLEYQRRILRLVTGTLKV